MYRSGLSSRFITSGFRNKRPPKSAIKTPGLRPFSRSSTKPPKMRPLSHKCGALAEPHYRYENGGYHPVLLGDTFKDGRYKVLHKLGWGGFATVWAARDLEKHEYVALKVCVAEIYGKNRESKVLRILADHDSGEPGSQHVMKLLDAFDVEGPNGKHECLVLEYLGPSVAAVVERYVMDPKLPGPIAKATMHQALLGLAYLHKHNIGHGDMHTGNLAFTIPSLHTLTEEELLENLGNPNTRPITRKDGKPLEANKPEYLVSNINPLSMQVLSAQVQIKIIDFGESFPHDDTPDKLNTPLCLGAPEALFDDKLDYRVDLWAAGCLIFELAAGQPPIDSMGATFNSVAATMTEFIKDDLPERWQEKFKTIDSDWFEESANELQKWLEEIYFDDRKRQIFTRQDIVKIGDLVRRLLRFEPSARASVDEILQDPWFKDENWEELLRPKSEEPPRPQSKDLLSPKSEELLKPKGDVEESKSEEVSKPQVVSVIGKVRP